MRRAMDRSEFMRRLVAKHGDRYDYSKTEFHKTLLPITVTCRIHGDFSQRADQHMRGGNCPECNRIAISKRMVGNKHRQQNSKRWLKLPMSQEQASALYSWLGDQDVTEAPNILTELFHALHRCAR